MDILPVAVGDFPREAGLRPIGRKLRPTHEVVAGEVVDCIGKSPPLPQMGRQVWSPEKTATGML